MPYKRRDFLRSAGLVSAGLLLRPNALFAQPDTPKKLKLGIIGVGMRGQSHLEMLLTRPDVEVVSIADIDDRMLKSAIDLVTKSGKKQPKIYKGNSYSYRNLLQDKELKAIIIATPWEWHTPMILDALEAGIKYVGTEVILGITLQDHWNVVQAAEKHQAHVMMLENVCYRRDVMAVLNMVRQGIFGEIIHLQGGYHHDLRGVKFNDGQSAYGKGVEFGEAGFSESKWRTVHSQHRNADLYPTHGIGPIAKMIDINRGNRFVSLCSFGSKARGLHNYIMDNAGPTHPNVSVAFSLGDVVTTNIKCANGETILLQHDTNLPRPYSLGFRVQGTKGLWMDVNESIYIEGKSKPHHWEAAQAWLDQYDHPLWKKYAASADGAGHGGMDFFVLHAFVEAAKRGLPTPQDVYDAASWSAITPLSEQSIALGNERVDFPDFTSGQWMYRKNDFAITDDF